MNRSQIYAGRSLRELRGRPILAHVVDRLRRVPALNQIVLCTSDQAEDDSLVALAQSLGIQVVRGSQDDVLRRILGAFDELRCSQAFIVRGDTPLIDPKWLEALWHLHQEKHGAYSYSEHLTGMPYGTGGTIVTREVLEFVRRLPIGNGKAQYYNVFLRAHDSHLQAHRLLFPKPDPDLRFVIETPRDQEFVEAVMTLAGEDALVEDLLGVLSHHPYVRALNRAAPTAQEVGLDKLLLFPDKVRALQEADSDDTYPVSVELSLTNACNLNCQWCSDRRLRSVRPGSLDFDVYARLVRDLAAHGTQGVVIEGGGEPTVHPRFKDALNLALSDRLAVGLITNGVRLDYEHMVPRMEWIRVSLDADTQANFAHWKGRDTFLDVLANIRLLCEIKDTCVVGVGYVVTRHNLEHLEEVAMLLADYGVDYLHLRPVVDHEDLRVNERLLYLKKYETSRFSVLLDAMAENEVSGNGGVPCLAHSLSCVVTADGAVFLCGRLNADPDWPPIGNLNQASFDTIWHGAERHRQCLLVRDPHFCRQHCPECRMTKYNLALARSIQARTRHFI